jgi:uncharacterized protein YjiS (DUF1127 family)
MWHNSLNLQHRKTSGRRAALRAMLGEWRRRTRARRELAQLSDRDLFELGIPPPLARAEVARPFWLPSDRRWDELVAARVEPPAPKRALPRKRAA